MIILTSERILVPDYWPWSVKFQKAGMVSFPQEPFSEYIVSALLVFLLRAISADIVKPEVPREECSGSH